ncbi:2TM domain-containing protein [Flagellimonas sp.]|uniref:2TM domain-containing protein n=1 Tax=Flagellimonas sp. TaxID=2058762 RepID=UPI003B5980AA
MKDLDKYEKAKKRVKELKGFYNHLKIFLVVNGLFYLVKSGLLTPLMPQWFPKEAYYYDWINGNFIIWGLMVVLHALIVHRHKFPFLRKWEERQIKKIMEQEQEERGKYK